MQLRRQRLSGAGGDFATHLRAAPERALEAARRAARAKLDRMSRTKANMILCRRRQLAASQILIIRCSSGRQSSRRDGGFRSRSRSSSKPADALHLAASLEMRAPGEPRAAFPSRWLPHSLSRAALGILLVELSRSSCSLAALETRPRARNELVAHVLGGGGQSGPVKSVEKRKVFGSRESKIERQTFGSREARARVERGSSLEWD